MIEWAQRHKHGTGYRSECILMIFWSFFGEWYFWQPMNRAEFDYHCLDDYQQAKQVIENRVMSLLSIYLRYLHRQQHFTQDTILATASSRLTLRISIPPSVFLSSNPPSLFVLPTYYPLPPLLYYPRLPPLSFQSIAIAIAPIFGFLGKVRTNTWYSLLLLGSVICYLTMGAFVFKELETGTIFETL